MELRQIEYFLKVVDSGSFSSAAAELYISQSSLSKQVIALEDELGVQLFDRTKRKISLTPAGKSFVPDARNLKATYQSMLVNLAAYKTTPTVSIVSIPVTAQYGIPAYIASFKQAFPDAQLILEEREASTIPSLLDDHQFDLAFLRDNFLDQTRYEHLDLIRDRFQVVLSRQHKLADRESVALTELSDENFIMLDKGTIVHELAVEACRRAGFEPRIFYASLRVESVLGMVASNNGVTLMMQKVFEYHIHPKVVAIPLKEEISSNLILTWRKNKNVAGPVADFIHFLSVHLNLTNSQGA